MSELASWNPPIRSHVWAENKGTIYIEKEDLLPYVQDNNYAKLRLTEPSNDWYYEDWDSLTYDDLPPSNLVIWVVQTHQPAFEAQQRAAADCYPVEAERSGLFLRTERDMLAKAGEVRAPQMSGPGAIHR